MERYRRIAAAAWRRVGGETVVVHLERNAILGLDERGGAVWEALGEPATLEELARAACGEGVGGAERAAVAAFLAELEAEGLVEREGEGAERVVPLGGGDAASPRILWRDRVHRAAGGCTFNPAGSLVCDQQPFNS